MAFLPLVSEGGRADNDAMDALSTSHPILSFRGVARRAAARPERADVVDLLDEARRYAAQLPVVRGRRERGSLVTGLDAVPLRLDTALHDLAADVGVDFVSCERSCLADELGRRRRIAPPARDALVALAPVLRAALAGDLGVEAREDVADIADRLARYLELRVAFG